MQMCTEQHQQQFQQPRQPAEIGRCSQGRTRGCPEHVAEAMFVQQLHNGTHNRCTRLRLKIALESLFCLCEAHLQVSSS